MAKLNPKIIRVDDTVRIVTPKEFVRCGYPLCLDDMMAAAEAEFSKWVSARRLLGERQTMKVIRIIAGELLASKRYGGRVRSIHTKETPELAGAMMRVCEIKTRLTGIYCQGSGSDFEDYDPSTLTNVRAHRILYGYIIHTQGQASIQSADIQIEAIHVQKITI